MTQNYFIGVDVGTGSVRAGLFTAFGKSVKWTKENIKTYNPIPEHYEQSSEEIWNACLKCIRRITEGMNGKYIRGIGFDATGSLVVLDDKGEPLTISTTGNNTQNVILWLDHRANKEAEEITRLNHPILKYIGGKMSVEMQIPKLMWLKRNMKEKCWDKAGYFFDLADFLTFKATGNDVRSLSALVCRWTYGAEPTEIKGWSKTYFHQIGLEDLFMDIKKIGTEVLAPGEPIPHGLNEKTAKEVGLQIYTPVGVSVVDAHAGGLGVVGCYADGLPNDFSSKLGLICGTSTCIMAVTKNPIFINGMWGPYYSAIVPGMWLNEGGQTATGKLIDHIISIHPASTQLNQGPGDKVAQEHLNDIIEELAEKKGEPMFCSLTKDFHMWPDFHGNRTPVADSNLRGMISGLHLGMDEEHLAVTYLSTIQALAYGTKHVVNELQKSGYDLKVVVICGGLRKNKLYLQTHADVLNMPVVIPDEKESVLLGAAILGACAAKHFESIEVAVSSMAGKGTVIHPDLDTLDYHNRKYNVFLKMLEHQREYKRIMNFCELTEYYEINMCDH